MAKKNKEEQASVEAQPEKAVEASWDDKKVAQVKRMLAGYSERVLEGQLKAAEGEYKKLLLEELEVRKAKPSKAKQASLAEQSPGKPLVE